MEHAYVKFMPGSGGGASSAHASTVALFEGHSQFSMLHVESLFHRATLEGEERA